MSGRKRGRRPGAPGSGLAMVENPDEVEDPAGCGGCGPLLSTEDSVGYSRRQVRDIPLVTVTVTEHRVHRCRCGGCGAVTSADLPGQVAGAPSSYGPNRRALAAYLLVIQHVPMERCAQLIADVTGARVSPGWVSSILAEAATTRIGAARLWLHVACTTTLTLLGLGERSRQGARGAGRDPARACADLPRILPSWGRGRAVAASPRPWAETVLGP